MFEQDLAYLKPRADWQDPIVIVGAGPVGMSAALGLSYYGVPCVVLDEGEGPASEGSRAIFMERHALEILGTWSPVGQQMAEKGMTLTGGRVFFRGTELYKTLTAPPEPDARYPRFVNVPQNVLEHWQVEALKKCECCEVRWQHRVTGIVQSEDEVCLEMMTLDGPRFMCASYVLAADGPRSTIRQLLKLDFPGESRDHHFLILDVRMQLETPRERWFWFDPPFNPGRTALLHPQPDGIYRLDYQLPPNEDLAKALKPDSIHKRIIATVGERPYEVVWKSIYSYQQRALSRFKHGRVLFLGDAAHLMSPFGGRGLNSGIQDANNVVWKLVHVRAGLAPAKLLDTYHDERHTAALENLRLTEDTMRFLVPAPGIARWKRDAILRLSLPFKFMRRYVNAGHMSNPFTYRDSPIVSEDKRARGAKSVPAEHRAAFRRFQHGPVAGALAPVVILTDAGNNRPISLLDCFGRSFVVLYFCADADEGLSALLRIRIHLPEIPLAQYLVARTPSMSTVVGGVRVLLDEEGKGASAYNAGWRTLYVVRPDRHIAVRRFESDLGDLPTVLRKAVGEGWEASGK